MKLQINNKQICSNNYKYNEIDYIYILIIYKNFY